MSGSKTVGNFVVSDTKNGIIISDKNQHWKLTFSIGTAYYSAIKHHLENADEESMNVIFSSMLYATAFAATDLGMIEAITNYYNKKNNIKPVEVTEESEKEDIEIVKQNLKDEEKRSKD